MVKDIRPGSSSGVAFDETYAVGSRVFFLASPDGVSGGVWASDGTDAGTRQVLGRPSSNDIDEDVGALGSTAFFGADDGTDIGLWKSNGTTSTFLDAFPTVDLYGFTAIGGTLYFTDGDKVYATTGSVGGVTTIDTPGCSDCIQELAALGSTLL